jgi:two-component system phosphate regulon sensor histidine kinase PhoR
MKRTLFARIFLGYAAVIVFLSLLITGISSDIVKKHIMESEKINLRAYNAVLKPVIAPYFNTKNYAGLEAILKKMKSSGDIRFTLIDHDGKVLADSERDPESMDNHKNRPEVRAAFEGSEGTAVRYSNTLSEDMLYLAEPVSNGKNGAAIILRSSIPLKDVKILANGLNNGILKALVFALAAAFAAAFLFSRNIYRPIRELADAAKKVAGGDFDTRVIIREKGEMRDLTDNFNFMTSQIKALFGEVTEKKKQLDAVIDAVAEGLIVTDEKGKIVLINKSFLKISGTQCNEGSFYWECLMPAAFNSLIEEGLKKRENAVEQVEIKNRMYLCSENFLEEKKQAAFVLYDITEFKDLERIKKDFVANVSHELRTPLTAIKGFAETLEQETKNPESTHYLGIIKNNTERLINIVSDLLTLSQLEQMEKPYENENVDLHELMGNAVKINEQAIMAKGLDISVDIEAGIPVLKGDFFRLEQVFINLIDNAVKYTEKGSIRVKAVKASSNMEISVADTGIGIPSEQLPRIFERFYVVDKSRSRKSGGTGLGLSIVKHIVQLHGGRIIAESEPGKGTVFTVVLPA